MSVRHPYGLRRRPPRTERFAWSVMQRRPRRTVASRREDRWWDRPKVRLERRILRVRKTTSPPAERCTTQGRPHTTGRAQSRPPIPPSRPLGFADPRRWPSLEAATTTVGAAAPTAVSRAALTRHRSRFHRRPPRSEPYRRRPRPARTVRRTCRGVAAHADAAETSDRRWHVGSVRTSNDGRTLSRAARTADGDVRSLRDGPGRPSRSSSFAAATRSGPFGGTRWPPSPGEATRIKPGASRFGGYR